LLNSSIAESYLIQLTNALMLKSVKNGLLSRNKSFVDMNSQISRFLIEIANKEEKGDSI
jgi:hypothetical protein